MDFDENCGCCQKHPFITGRFVSVPGVKMVGPLKATCGSCGHLMVAIIEIPAPTMREMHSEIAMALFGVPNDGKQCVTCISKHITYPDFRDALSWKEFGISGMCQSCQDKVFKDEEE